MYCFVCVHLVRGLGSFSVYAQECTSVWERVVVMNAEQISNIFPFLSQFLHADCLCRWSLGFSSHESKGCRQIPISADL